jgi:hypothetical protein
MNSKKFDKVRMVQRTPNRYFLLSRRFLLLRCDSLQGVALVVGTRSVNVRESTFRNLICRLYNEVFIKKDLKWHKGSRLIIGQRSWQEGVKVTCDL